MRPKHLSAEFSVYYLLMHANSQLLNNSINIVFIPLVLLSIIL